MLITFVRTAVLYIVVILCMRIMGKRQIGELQPSELVVTILISELASIPMQDLNRPVTNGIIAIFTLVILEILLSTLEMKLPFFKRLFSGTAAIVILDGKIDQKAMRRLRITIEDLQHGLRQSGSFAIENVECAVMETSGKLSVLPKKEFAPPTASELSVNVKNSGFPFAIIIDGKLQPQTLTMSGLKTDDIFTRLKEENLSIKDVFLMTSDKNKKILVIKKEI
ncbi:MAG: DUF421 domain-containing protein [Clostridia bacterium]|nr:DUF421 domain-containing protein [Clostridia bacterium]